MPVFVETEKIGKLKLKDTIEKAIKRRNGEKTEKFDEETEKHILKTNEMIVKHIIFDCEVTVQTIDEPIMQQDVVKFELLAKGNIET